MLDKISKVLKLQDEYPPIHYSYIPPVGFPLPREYSEKIGNEVNGIYVEWIGLENFSGKVQKNIRIKLNNSPDFEPQFEASRALKSGDWAYDKERLELTVKQLDPRESIYISLFHRHKGDINRTKPLVIINDQVLSKPMEWHGYARKYVGHTVLMAVMIALVAWTAYWTFRQMNERPTFKDLTFIESKLKNFVACSPYVINPQQEGVDFKKEISSSIWPLPAILQINNVLTETELQNLQKVILCKSK